MHLRIIVDKFVSSIQFAQLTFITGYLFYLRTHGMHASFHTLMTQKLYLNSYQYCFSFYYQMKSDVNFNIHVSVQVCFHLSILFLSLSILFLSLLLFKSN